MAAAALFASPSLQSADDSNESCVEMAYNHYVQLGQGARNAWTNAIRDCQAGVDPQCLKMAIEHYRNLGQDESTAWNNAVRDCRALTPR
jgi:hypothetical protein